MSKFAWFKDKFKDKQDIQLLLRDQLLFLLNASATLLIILNHRSFDTGLLYNVWNIKIMLVYQLQASSLVAAAAEAFVGDSSRHSEKIRFVNYRRCCFDCAMLPGNHPIRYHHLRRKTVVCYVISFQALGIRSAKKKHLWLWIYSQINSQIWIAESVWIYSVLS